MEIQDYNFGRITIAGQTYHHDVIVFPDKVQDGWWRKEGHKLYVEDLETVVAAKPGVLIVGTGYYGNMVVPHETIEYFNSQDIMLHLAKTPKAVELFNTMRQEAEVVAALHLTC